MEHRGAGSTFLVLAGGVAVVSTASILIRYAQAEGASSLAIAAGRLGLAAAVLSPFSLPMLRRELPALTSRHLLLCAASGLLLAIHFWAWIASLEYTSVASSTALVTTNPLWVALASAWLLRRFVDRNVRFKFVSDPKYRPAEREVRFDMFEAEYTHRGDRCTFEVLLDEADLKDPALSAIGEIVHDIDIKDGKYRRDEAAGIARMIAGLARRHSDDHERTDRAMQLFDDLYASLAPDAA